MTFLSDRTLQHLRDVADQPDLTGTRYRLVSRIARGGMGTVYLAEDAELARPVALKVLSAPDLDGSLARRLLNEARILAQLEHPGIVPVHDVGTLPDGRVFYVMQLVRGRTLDGVISTLTERTEALRIFQRLCEAVAFAHAHGVLHRDLKPQNIMVGEFGEVLVMDWGVAKVLRTRAADDALRAAPAAPQSTRSATSALTDNGALRAAPAAPQSSRPATSAHTDDPESYGATHMPGAPTYEGPADTLSAAGAGTQHGTRIGTPGFMAPEQASGDVARIDERTDVFGLGSILVFLLVHGGWIERRAPHATTPQAALDNVRPPAPRALRAICRRALAADPEARYASVDQLAAELRRFADGQAVLAYPEGPLRRTTRFVSRYRTAVALVLTYMVVRVLLLLLG